MSCYCKCSAALPHGAVDWSAVRDYDFPDYTYLLFDTCVRVGDFLKTHSFIHCLTIFIGQ